VRFAACDAGEDVRCCIGIELRRWARGLLAAGVLLGCGDAGTAETGSSGGVGTSGGAPTGGAGTVGTTAGDTTGAETTTGGEPQGCLEAAASPGVARRMTRLEYNNTVRDLLGDATRPADGFAAEEVEHGFNNNSAALTVTELLAEQYMAAAEALAAAAVQDVAGLVGCDPLQVGELACAQRFIATFGRRAYRRPLLADEQARLVEVFNIGAADGFAAGIELTLQTILQSPNFLYRVEAGEVDAALPAGLRRATNLELASRLSFWLWRSGPDDVLLAAAEAGTLQEPAVLRAQAERLLADPRGRAGMRDFWAQLMDIESLDGAAKDAATFPEFTEEIRGFMREELDRFVEHVIFDDDGLLTTLMAAPYTFLNAALADYYMLPGSAGPEFMKVDLPADHPRRGLLTQGGLLTLLGKYDSTAPVHRGKFVRQQLLCTIILPPPDVEFMPPEIDPNATTREKYKEHSSNPACAGCHQFMDPLGFGFEHFDGAGRYRAVENGFPIDASGEVIGGGEAALDGPFDGVGELATRLAGSEVVRACLVRQQFRHTFGREATAEDRCTLDRLELAFAGGEFNKLMLAVLETDAFRLLAVEGP
jgi:hypothetical protein